jgi:hypothetical protein
MRLAIVAMVILFESSFAFAAERCTANNRLYSDGALNSLDGKCQRCADGQWIIRQSNECNRCSMEKKPNTYSGHRNHSSLKNASCVYADRWFPDRATTFNAGVCQVCNGINWIDKTCDVCQSNKSRKLEGSQ